jgi:hypothetical protein
MSSRDLARGTDLAERTGQAERAARRRERKGRAYNQQGVSPARPHREECGGRRHLRGCEDQPGAGAGSRRPVEGAGGAAVGGAGHLDQYHPGAAGGGRHRADRPAGGGGRGGREGGQRGRQDRGRRLERGRRPASDPALSLLFPGGVRYYVQLPVIERHHRMELLASLLESGGHTKLDPAVAKAAVDAIRPQIASVRTILDSAAAAQAAARLASRMVRPSPRPPSSSWSTSSVATAPRASPRPSSTR